MPLSIQKVCEDIRSRPWRDVDENMDREYAMHTELGDLVRSFQDACPDHAYFRLGWLSIFAAGRALPCWELYCDGNAPQDAVIAVRNFLLSRVAPRTWKSFTKAAMPAYKGTRIIDCRECDTGCAAESAAQAAKFIATQDSLHAVSALSAAYMAFDQSPLGRLEEFDHWLLNIAVPAAYDCRDLTAEEKVAFRNYSDEDVRSKRLNRAR